jgi:hypothetical protein
VVLFFVAGLYALTDAFFIGPYLSLETPPVPPPDGSTAIANPDAATGAGSA